MRLPALSQWTKKALGDDQGLVLNVWVVSSLCVACFPVFVLLDSHGDASKAFTVTMSMHAFPQIRHCCPRFVRSYRRAHMAWRAYRPQAAE